MALCFNIPLFCKIVKKVGIIITNELLWNMPVIAKLYPTFCHVTGLVSSKTVVEMFEAYILK